MANSMKGEGECACARTSRTAVVERRAWSRCENRTAAFSSTAAQRPRRSGKGARPAQLTHPRTLSASAPVREVTSPTVCRQGNSSAIWPRSAIDTKAYSQSWARQDLVTTFPSSALPQLSSVCVFQATEPHRLDRYNAQIVEKPRGGGLGHSASFAEEM
jgi:hypothetical protein